MKTQKLISAAALAAMACLSRADFSFVGIGDLSGGTFSSYANAISSDGSVVVGNSRSGNGIEAFRWTQTGGMTGLGDLAGGTFYSSAAGVSSDGSVVVGVSNSANGSEAFRWTQSGGLIGLGDLDGGMFSSGATGVSGDGSIVVGGGTTADGPEAFMWTQADGMTGLGDLSGGSIYSYATAISADGTTIVGYSNSTNGFEAFKWTEASGMTGLGDLAGGAFNSSANAVNADGSVIVGNATSASGTEAFRYTQSGGMLGLGDLPGGAFFSSATGVSADGSVVVGRSASANGMEAFVWSESLGMVSLKDYLVSHGVQGLDDWALYQASGISADGKTIFGYGANPSGNVEAWIATADVPRSVQVNAFTLFRGIVLSGNLQSLVNSDNNRLEMRPGIVLSAAEAPIQLIVDGTSPSSTLSRLKFQVESQADRANIGQWIDLYDFSAQAYVQMDMRNLTTSDVVYEVNVMTDAQRFLEPGTLKLRARLRYKPVAPLFSYPWKARVDQTIWMIVP